MGLKHRIQRYMDGDKEPDRDAIDESIAVRRAMCRVNLKIVANRLSAGDDIEATLRAVYSGDDPQIKLAADIRRLLT